MQTNAQHSHFSLSPLDGSSKREQKKVEYQDLRVPHCTSRPHLCMKLPPLKTSTQELYNRVCKERG
jgi:hypothetical protein